MRLFDSEGVALLQTMQRGAEGIRKIREEADALGLTLTQKQANQMAAVKDAAARLQAAYTGLANTIVVQLGPSLEALANFLSNVLPNVSSVGARSIAAFKTFFFELGASISGAIANLEEFTAKITFGNVAKRHLDAARAARQRETELWQKAAQETQVQLEALLDTETRFSVRAGEGFKNLGIAAVSTTKQLRSEADKLQRILDRLFPERARARQFAEELALLKEKFGENSEEVRRLQEEFAKATGGPRKLADSMKKSAEEVSSFARDMGLTFSSAFEDAVLRGERLRKVMQGLAQDIARIVLRKKVTEPFGDFVAGVVDKFLPKFADGGITPGGPVIVGERGPEVLIPPRGSRVVPNSQIGGSTSIVINQAFDFSGANPATVEQLRRQSERIKHETIATLRDMKVRGRLPEFA